jgi:subtilase family serine protease
MNRINYLIRKLAGSASKKVPPAVSCLNAANPARRGGGNASRRFRRTGLVALPVLATLAFTVAVHTQTISGTPTKPLISLPIDENNRVVLRGNTRPEATAVNDRGRVEDSLPLDHLQLLLKRPPDREQALVKLIDEMHDPASPNYHKWLTAAELGEQFGLAHEDVDKVTAWLTGHGFTVNQVYVSGNPIDFSGTAGQIRGTLHTEIHNLEVNGERHIANMSDPEIPAALEPAVVGVASLNDFKPHAMVTPKSEYFTVANGTHDMAPADLATIYNLNPLFAQGYTGKGQTIVVLEDSDLYTAADVTTFRQTFGLSVAAYPFGSFQQVHPGPGQGGTCTDPDANGVNSSAGEETLDVEWATMAAPNAAIVLASCANTQTAFGVFIALQNMLTNGNPLPQIVSISYGDGETEVGSAYNAYVSSLYQTAVAEGVSVFVAAGDSGAATADSYHLDPKKTPYFPVAVWGITVNGFASTIYNVAVGGTDFFDIGFDSYWTSNGPFYSTATGYIPEIPWNSSCASALLASFYGYSTAYGPSGFCNSTWTLRAGEYLNATAGGGGPSACTTGSPSANSDASSGTGSTCAGRAKPGWQSGLFGNPADGVRDLPDVSLFAANGAWGHSYVYCWSDLANGGASCSGAPAPGPRPAEPRLRRRSWREFRPSSTRGQARPKAIPTGRIMRWLTRSTASVATPHATPTGALSRLTRAFSTM